MFRAGTFALGRLRIKEDLGEPFWITDSARTVVDAYRLRHQIGEDLAHAALREYLRSGRKHTCLAELAQPLNEAWQDPDWAVLIWLTMVTGFRPLLPHAAVATQDSVEEHNQ